MAPARGERSSTTRCRCCARSILVAVTLRAIDALTTFDQVYVLTRGGPGTSTQLISIYGYQTFFQFQQIGYAAAMLFMVALVVLVGAGLRGRRSCAGGRR